jgi:3-hydroxyisobutyrate dehydrogenase
VLRRSQIVGGDTAQSDAAAGKTTWPHRAHSEQNQTGLLHSLLRRTRWHAAGTLTECLAQSYPTRRCDPARPLVLKTGMHNGTSLALIGGQERDTRQEPVGHSRANAAFIGAGRDAVKVAYVGLGGIGGAIARRLVSLYDLAVWDSDPELAVRWTRDGASFRSDLPALARGADLIFICLKNASDAAEVLFGSSGLLESLSPGTILIDQTVSDPDEVRKAAAKLKKSKVSLIDAPVSGHYQNEDLHSLSIMASGMRESFDVALPYLEAICPQVFYCGDAGNAQALHFVNSSISVCCQIATLEIVAMGRKFGLSLDTMADVINKGSGRNRTSQVMLPALAQGQRSSTVRLSDMLKTLELSTQRARRVGVPSLVSNIAQDLLQSALNQLGEDATMDDTVVMIERMAGTMLRP